MKKIEWVLLGLALVFIVIISSYYFKNYSPIILKQRLDRMECLFTINQMEHDGFIFQLKQGGLTTIEIELIVDKVLDKIETRNEL